MPAVISGDFDGALVLGLFRTPLDPLLVGAEADIFHRRSSFAGLGNIVQTPPAEEIPQRRAGRGRRMTIPPRPQGLADPCDGLLGYGTLRPAHPHEGMRLQFFEVPL